MSLLLQDKKTIVFTHLPGFAKFLRDERLDDFVREQLSISREIELPLLQFFESLSEEEMMKFSRATNASFLTSLVDNKAGEHIQTSLTKWLADELPRMGREQIIAEDITLISYMRKRAFLKFLPEYTTDVPTMLAIVGDLDRYVLELETASTNTYIQLLKDHTNDEVYTKEKIVNTIPGTVYVYDLLTKREIYTNTSTIEAPTPLRHTTPGPGASVVERVLHQDDLKNVNAHLAELASMQDGEIRTIEYRVRTADGSYRWQRSYEGIFRRMPTGAVWQNIGIVFDIDDDRKVAEQLQHREEQLLEAQQLAGMGSFEWDPEVEEGTVTPQVLKILDLKKGDTFKTFLSRVHPFDRPMVRAAVERAIQDKGFYDCEYRYNVNGTEKILWSTGAIAVINDRPVLKGTVMDVTERHYMIQRLQRSEHLYKQAQAVTHIGNYTWELSGDKLNWSDELYRIYELDPENRNITSELLRSWNHPDDNERVMNEIGTSLRTGEPFDFYYRILLPGGKVKILQARGEVLRDDNQMPYKILGTAQDVTDKQELIERLQQSERFIRKIADAAPSIITSYNVHTGKYVFVNRSIKKLLDYEPEEVLQQGITFVTGLVHPDDIAALTDRNSRALEASNRQEAGDGNEHIVEFQYRLRHNDGAYRWFHTYGTVFDRNSNGQVEHVLNISLDITDSKEAEQVLFQKNLELQRSNNSLEEFAYVASHDLQEPLRKISTFGDRLLTTQYARLDADGRIYLEKIISSSLRMQQMINDLLSISIISGNKTFQVYSLQNLLDEVLQTLEYKIEESGAVIKADPLPAANIIPSQFRQLFQNLLSNSLKFAKKNVPPEIIIKSTLLQKPDEWEEYQLPRRESYLQLQFADNGIGFNKIFVDKIFSIFQRLHSRNEYAGTGIGLAICKKVVENHGGIISATGAPDQGAQFTIVIPA